MVKLRIHIILFFTILVAPLPAINYLTTAESVSWNGAHASISEGMEAILYNPAGLYMSPTRYGLNLFGSYGLRFYNNSISTDGIIKFLEAGITNSNISETGVISQMLQFMPITGFDTGVDISMLNFMSYFRMKKFTFGISMIPKTSFTAVISKQFFTTIFDGLDLMTPQDFNVKFTMTQYIDFNFNLSTRAGFLEKLLPVEGIYVGFSGHFYLPTIYIKGTTTQSRVEALSADPLTGLLSYRVSLAGDLDWALTSVLLSNLTVF